MVRYDVEEAPLTQESTAPIQFREAGRSGLLRRVAALVGCAVLVVGAVAVASVKSSHHVESTGAMNLAAQVPEQAYDAWDIAPGVDTMDELDMEVDDDVAGGVDEARLLASKRKRLARKQRSVTRKLERAMTERDNYRWKRLKMKQGARRTNSLSSLASSPQYKRLGALFRSASTEVRKLKREQRALSKLLSCNTLACMNGKEL